jgi:hypothetical protein
MAKNGLHVNTYGLYAHTYGLYAHTATDLEQLARTQLVQVTADLNFLREASFPLKREFHLLPQRHNCACQCLARNPQP